MRANWKNVTIQDPSTFVAQGEGELQTLSRLRGSVTKDAHTQHPADENTSLIASNQARIFYIITILQVEDTERIR